MERHLILVGLPGAGKSTVGRLAAAALAVPFVDPDTEIVRSQGCSIPELFRTLGEPRFRVLEREAVARALAGPAAVIAPGGGWGAQPGALEQAGNRALLVHLATDPAVAAHRLGPDDSRPLLAGGDRVALMQQLWVARYSFYSRAHVEVRTEGRTPADVAQEVVQLARSQGSW